MKKIGITLSLAAAIGAATALISTAQAAPAGTVAGQLGAAADSLSLIEKTQFLFGGQEYCWYDDAWNGPGWYWCGYATRQGSGWGGRVGWHHWDRHHPPRLHGPVHGPGSSHNPVPFKPGGKPPRRPPSHLSPLPSGVYHGGGRTDPDPRPR